MKPGPGNDEPPEWNPYAAPVRRVRAVRMGDAPDQPRASCLKVAIVWFLPTFVVPLLLLFLAAAWPVAVLVTLGFLVFMGHLSAGGGRSILDPDTSAGGRQEIRWGQVVLYVVLQLVWIAGFWFAVASALLWWACGRSGSGI